MMKKKLIIGMFALLMFSSLVSALEKTSLNPDEYYCDEGVANCSRIFDNDWETFTYNPGGATGRVDMEYNKPLNVKSGIWDIKIGISAEYAQQTGQCWDGNFWVEIFQDSNFTINRSYPIPQSCFDQDPVQFQVIMDSASGKFVYFYEEQVRWETDSEEVISYGEALELPQLESSVEIDDSGLERTYLYCIWHIDDISEEVNITKMDTLLCPDPTSNFTFYNDETYYTRIERADIFWNATEEQWQILGIDTVDEAIISYSLDVPEPPDDLFMLIITMILDAIRDVLCDIFPWLGICD